MSVPLTEEQRLALEGAGGAPLTLTDPVTNTAYVLVRAEVYERLKDLAAENEFDPRDAYPLVDRVMAEEDASDPHLESYQHPPHEGRS
jgi:hypothetical protein